MVHTVLEALVHALQIIKIVAKITMGFGVQMIHVQEMTNNVVKYQMESFVIRLQYLMKRLYVVYIVKSVVMIMV